MWVLHAVVVSPSRQAGAAAGTCVDTNHITVNKQGIRKKPELVAAERVVKSDQLLCGLWSKGERGIES